MYKDSSEEHILTPKLQEGYATWEGMKFGFKTGLGLSLAYATLGILVVEIKGLGLGLLGIGIILVLPIIFFHAILPAVMIGTLTGMVFGIIAEVVNTRISQLMCVIFGVLICAMLAILFHLIFGIQVGFSFENTKIAPSGLSAGIYETYPFLIGIPTIIYILTGGWANWRFYSKMILQKMEQN